MSILINKNTKVLVQGITGRDGKFHTQKMLEYGTQIVGGVTPGKGGQTVESLPVFNSMLEAKKHTNATATVIYVPAPFAKEAILEAVHSEMELIVCITEGIPVYDSLLVYNYIKDKKVRLIGPNCPGLLVPDEAKIGIMPGQIAKRGPVGVVSKSGTLTYEVVNAISSKNIGQSTCIGIGGDPIVGTSFIDILDLFQKDPETEAIALIGEIGGTDEEEAAEYIKKNISKPVFSFIAGKTAPKGKRMGHAGAIISGNLGTVESKSKALKSAGVHLCETPTDIAEQIVAKI